MVASTLENNPPNGDPVGLYQAVQKINQNWLLESGGGEVVLVFQLWILALLIASFLFIHCFILFRFNVRHLGLPKGRKEGRISIFL